MTEKDKNFLLKDLCARLLYGVMVHLVYDDDVSFEREMGIGSLHDIMFDNVVDAKPYLRPMSSMTEKEQHEYDNLRMDNLALPKVHLYYPMRWHTMDYLHVDWLNAHHFDYRGLIEKGLALEAPENMYKTV